MHRIRWHFLLLNVRGNHIPSAGKLLIALTPLWIEFNSINLSSTNLDCMEFAINNAII
jgi:hypothetical protein